ncbi:TPA: 50S ribosomal protein L5 [Candidatus Dependentiae bacterium]|nr:50S ribosomal protein L5 [Candidatus Dependentiae bacterium]
MPASANRLKAFYETTARPNLQKTLGLENIMQVPKISKIVINMGVKEAVSDSKELQVVAKVLEAIAGQAPVKTAAKKSIAGFKIREGMNIGVCVTLRGPRMYTFLDKLISLSLPKVRDFQGIPSKLDGRGNYNLGIKEWNIFPEAESAGAGEKMHGLNITICTTAQSDEHGLALLKELGMPFTKTGKVR